MRDYATSPIYPFARLRSGYAFKSADWSETGIRVVKIANVGDGELNLTNGSRVSAETAGIAKNAGLHSGDVLVGMTGYVGSVARVRPRDLPCVLNQRVGIVEVTDPEAVSLDYLYFALRSQYAKAQMESFAHGSAQPNLSPKGFGQVEIAIPPLPEQRRIAGVLGVLDDLIDINQRLSESLYALVAAVVSRSFAGASQTIPLSQTARFVNGKNFTKGASGHGLPVIRTPEVRIGPTETTVRSDVEAGADNRVSAGDILFVWSGSLLVGRWRWEEGLVNQHVFKVIPEDGFPDWLVYSLIQHQMPWFLSLASDKATTMGHIQRKHLDAPVPALGGEEVSRLDEHLSPLWDQALASSQEASQLRRTRDELLPLLMSGAVSPGEAEVAA